MSGLSIGIGVGLKYFSPIRKGKVTPPPIDPSHPKCCIHRSKNYGRTNEDADRDRIIDLSGTGTDIQLYNFGYAGNSGFGLYPIDFTASNYKFYQNRGTIVVTSSKITITKALQANVSLIENISETYQTPSYKIKVTGISDIDAQLFINWDNVIATRIIISEDGIYTIPQASSAKLYTNGIGFTKVVESCNITIKLIPDYKGALVSDGVDDYGLCENFPILTSDRGYTVCIIRKILEDNKKVDGGFMTKGRITDKDGAFFLERYYFGTFVTYNFGGANYPKVNSNTSFVYQNSKSYTGQNLINKGKGVDNNILSLFAYNDKGGGFLKSALYALEIYDRDLSEEEIAAVKARMIREYEEGTGLPYDEAGYFKLNNGKLDIDKLK